MRMVQGYKLVECCSVHFFVPFFFFFFVVVGNSEFEHL